MNLINQQTTAFSNSNEQTIDTKTDESTDAAQKEEWLEFLKKTIWDVMYAGDVDVLIQKHSLMLIMNAFNSCKKCPTVVTTVARLLSLPFVVELISESQLTSIKQVNTFFYNLPVFLLFEIFEQLLFFHRIIPIAES